MSTRAEPPRRAVPGSPFGVPAEPPAEVAVFAVGDRVTHDQHGLGTVLLVGYPNILRIDFGAGGIQQLPATDERLTAL